MPGDHHDHDDAHRPMTVDAARSWYVLARLVDYLGIAFFLGGSGFVALLWPAGSAVRATRRVIVTGWLLGVAGAAATIVLEGVWAGGGPIGWPLVTRVLATDFGRVWLAIALLWVLAGVVLADLLQRKETAARSAAWRIGALAVGLGLLRAIGLTGHTSDSGAALVEIADLAHLLGMALWIGGLAVLLFGVLPRRRPEELARVVPRYSRLAMISVGTVVLAGVVLAWQSLGSVDALLHTDYGRILLVKVGVLAVVLAAAQASKSWVGRRLDFAVVLRGDARTLRPFVYSVTAETVLVVFVLLAASVLVTANPGR
ncbi:MAG TPA: CopD family protein [Kutzneria sp.]|nr:CopD family protein [Kutzneria sp.]